MVTLDYQDGQFVIIEEDKHYSEFEFLFVMVVAPCDHSFVGPFYSIVQATKWIDANIKEPLEASDILTIEQLKANVREFGSIDIHDPKIFASHAYAEALAEADANRNQAILLTPDYDFDRE